MDKSVKTKVIICFVVAVFSIWLLLPTYWTLNNPDKEGKAPSWMPHSAMKLGLDLRGGIHMVMGVDLDKVVVDQLATYGRSLQKTLTESKIEVTTLVNEKTFELDITPKDPTQKSKIAEIIGKDFSALDFVGEDEKTQVTRLSRAQEDFVRTHAIDQSIETIRNRIDEFGVAEPVISRKGDSQIMVQFPGEQEPERLKNLIGQTAKLTFQIVHGCNRNDPGCLETQRNDLHDKITKAETAGPYKREDFKRLSEYRTRLNTDLKKDLPPDTELAFEKQKDGNVVGKTDLIPFLLSTKDQLSGEYIENAFVQLHQENNIGAQKPVVAFQLNPVGAPIFGDLTTEFKGYYMAIVLDGIVRSAPVLNTPITGGSGIITLGSGSFDDMNREARELSIVLRAGALPATIEVLEERVIGPSIGVDAIRAGKSALVVTSVIIFAFMWLYYGAAGLIGNFATLVNIALVFSMLGAVGATLTLPGIAGIVLTIGMAVDAMIIIFERMREELRAGRHGRAVIAVGFDKALSTILDSNITTAIGAFVLLEYGSGSIRGFGLTLLVGIIVNVFVATFFMKTLFEVFMGKTHTVGVGLSADKLNPVRVEG